MISVESASKLIDGIVVYMSADPLTRLALEMVAHSLCADQVQALRVEFQAMDRNHEGVLCLQDFLDALQAAPAQNSRRNSVDAVY